MCSKPFQQAGTAALPASPIADQAVGSCLERAGDEAGGHQLVPQVEDDIAKPRALLVACLLLLLREAPHTAMSSSGDSGALGSAGMAPDPFTTSSIRWPMPVCLSRPWSIPTVGGRRDASTA